MVNKCPDGMSGMATVVMCVPGDAFSRMQPKVVGFTLSDPTHFESRSFGPFSMFSDFFVSFFYFILYVIINVPT